MFPNILIRSIPLRDQQKSIEKAEALAITENEWIQVSAPCKGGHSPKLCPSCRMGENLWHPCIVRFLLGDMIAQKPEEWV